MTPVEAIAWGVIGAIGLCIVCIIVFSTYFWCRRQYINYLLSNYLKKDSNRGETNKTLPIFSTRSEYDQN